MGTATALKINFERLKADVTALSEIGKSGNDHGIYRMAFTEGDMEGRRWLQSRIEDGGLELHQDGAANIFGRYRYDGQRQSVITGSHIDTVPAAGHLDGALGVLVGLECLRTIRENNIETEHALEMCAFTDEEGRFGGLFGSQSLVGDVTPQRIETAHDLNGIKLIDAMAAQGLNAKQALDARRKPETVRGYLELHIEQGPVLDRQGVSIGVVEQITGLFKWQIRLIGHADHAGTTPMDMRKDAFGGLAEFSGEIPRILEEHGRENSRATIGKVDLFPGSANTVPGKVEFSLDCRDTNYDTLRDLANAFRLALSAIARRRGLMFEFDILSEVKPVDCDAEIMAAIQQSAQELGINSMHMPSGAAHDAQIIAKLTPVGMIFVPSKDGRSHSAAEWTHWEDIERGANVALHTLMKMAGAR